MCIYTNIHTYIHTHTHTYIYIERERERVNAQEFPDSAFSSLSFQSTNEKLRQA